jgi:hypothetical protein
MAVAAKEHAKLRVEDEVDFMLDRLIFAKKMDVREARKDCLFLPHQMMPLWMNIRGVHDDMLFSVGEDVNHPKLVWPLKFGMASILYDDQGQFVQCAGFQSVPAKALRGKYRFVNNKYNIAYYYGRTIEELQFLSAVEFASWAGSRWRSSQRLRFDQEFIKNVKDAGTAPIERYVDKGEDDIGASCAQGQAAALTYRYEWGAQFSIGGSAKVIVPTTPKGVLELFNDRDKPEDRDRRAALRHWVSQHRRQTKPQSFTQVKAHLRGETKFEWRGFDVQIVPSQFDREKVAA